jgi:hypothetical protein
MKKIVENIYKNKEPFSGLGQFSKQLTNQHLFESSYIRNFSV